MSADPAATESAPRTPWYNAIPAPIGWILYILLLLLLAAVFWRPLRDWWVAGDIRAAGATVWYAKGLYIVAPGDKGAVASVLNVSLTKLTALDSPLWLWLEDTDATDETLVYLEGVDNIVELNLANTKITDAGIPHLKRIGQLRGLDLHGTNVTDKGIAALHKALPRCDIKK